MTARTARTAAKAAAARPVKKAAPPAAAEPTPVKKTPAKKAPAKKTTAAQRTAAARAQGRKVAPRAEMEGATPPPAPAPPASAPETLPEEIIEFRGRQITVRMPSLESLAIMQRMSERFAGAEGQKMPIEQALRLQARAIDVVMSVVVQAADKDWLESEFLAGGLELDEAQQILRKAIVAIRARNANRAERRAAAKAATRTR